MSTFSEIYDSVVRILYTVNVMRGVETINKTATVDILIQSCFYIEEIFGNKIHAITER